MTSNIQQTPRLSGDTIVIDMDFTIVHHVLPADRGDPYFTTFNEMLQAQRGIDAAAAQELIDQTGVGPECGDLYAALADLDIGFNAYLEALLPRIVPYTKAYDDAVETLAELRRRGYRIFPATTNGRIACLVKLSAVGLADHTGSPYFDDLFGGDDVSPGGKDLNCPQFFTALLERVDRTADQVIMVGDDPKTDLANARGAGIEQVVLPRRDQDQDYVIEPDGGIYVKSLTVMLPWLDPPAPGSGRPEIQ